MIYASFWLQVVNGKEIQISLTGFMEKNTGKFMKELWILLLSAQKNASGVPQQFLDAKEEETRKKKVQFCKNYSVTLILLVLDEFWHISYTSCHTGHCRLRLIGYQVKFKRRKRERVENLSKRK